jgi:preprotein translocase subunit SecD
VNLPSKIPIKFQINKWKVNTSIGAPVIDFKYGDGKEYKKEFVTKFGLDLQGGSHFVFEADTSKLKDADISDAIHRQVLEPKTMKNIK